MLAPEIAELLARSNAAARPPLAQIPLAEARAWPTFMTTLLRPPAQRARAEALAIPGPAGAIAAMQFEPAQPARGLICYLHGGGWVLGSTGSYRLLLENLAQDSGCRVVSVDYRLAPEHPFPAAFEDAVAAAEWLAGQAGELPLVLMGDSAGANLVAAALHASARLRQCVRLQVLLYPNTDSGLDTASFRDCGSGYLLTRENMQWFWEQYIPDPGQRTDPRAAVLRASQFAGQPAAYVATAQYDPLRDEGEAYAARLRAAGTPVQGRCWPGLVHGYIALKDVCAAAAAAYAEVTQAIRAAIA